MRIARPIRVDAGKAKYLSQSLDKARFVGLVGLCESAIYVKHHEFHEKCECRLTRIRPNFWVFQEKDGNFGSNQVLLLRAHRSAPGIRTDPLSPTSLRVKLRRVERLRRDKCGRGVRG